MERRRAIAAAGKGLDAELWSGLVAQGVAGLAVPERHGGAGLGVLDAAVAAESLGYHAAPGAFAASLVMAPLALQASGTEAQQQEWLPRIASGEARIAVGFAGAVGQTGAAKRDLRRQAALGQGAAPARRRRRDPRAGLSGRRPARAGCLDGGGRAGDPGRRASTAPGRCSTSRSRARRRSC